MARDRRRRESSRRWIAWLAAPVAAVVAVVLWRAVRVGPAPTITLATEREAVGPDTGVGASFAEPRGGLGEIRLEIEQEGRVEVLASRRLSRPGALSLGVGERVAEARLEGRIGRTHQAWLREGEVVVRAVAERAAGPLRSPSPTVVERRLPVTLRPPRLAVLSSVHYVRQGGSGAVVLSVGGDAVRSGVRAGTVESRSFPLPGGGPGEVFVLYAVPWDLDRPDIRAFAEDAAGNRAEVAFVDGFRVAPPRTDTVRLRERFLESVVPAIAARTPSVPSEGSLLDRYLYINGPLRAENLSAIRRLCGGSGGRPLWSGAFLQMPGTARMASFAQRRTYVYEGRVVDHQTHLGLDLASTSRAPVPAANAGRVIFAGWLGIYGNAVLLDHGAGLASLYGHLSAVAVSEGEMVDRGQTIGRSGATGLAGGDHLHLEIFVQGQSVDPMEWLDPAWVRDRIGSKLQLAEGDQPAA